jgi:hypothetical protein
MLSEFYRLLIYRSIFVADARYDPSTVGKRSAFMSNIKRYLLHGFTSISLIMFIAAATLSIRSGFWMDEGYYKHRWIDRFNYEYSWYVAFISRNGGIWLQVAPRMPDRPVPSAIHIEDSYGWLPMQPGPTDNYPVIAIYKHPRGAFGFSYGYQFLRMPNGSLNKEREIVFPLPVVVIFFSLLPCWWLLNFSHRLRGKNAGLCPQCGYDLRATPDRCPECGTEPRVIKQS